MTGPTTTDSLGARAAAAVAGESVADRVLAAIAAGTSDPDVVARGVTKALAIDGLRVVPGDGLRAFARRIAKRLEGVRDAR